MEERRPTGGRNHRVRDELLVDRVEVHRTGNDGDRGPALILLRRRRRVAPAPWDSEENKYYPVGSTGPMSVDRFVDHLQDRAGEALRVVAWYTEDSSGGLYIRPDLDRPAVKERMRYLADRLHDRDADRENPLTELGDEEAMVQVREDVVILRFPLDRETGLVVSMNVDVATDLHSFVIECAGLLDGVSLSVRASN